MILVQILGVDPAVVMTAVRDLAPVIAVATLDMHAFTVMQHVGYVVMR